MHKLTWKQLSWAAIKGSFATKHLERKHTRAQEETVQQRGENLVTSPLGSPHTFPSKLREFDRRKIMFFISSNRQQKIYVHGVKDLILFSHGSSSHGVLHLKSQLSVSWWKFMQPLLDCAFCKISFPRQTLCSERRRAGLLEVKCIFHWV